MQPGLSFQAQTAFSPEQSRWEEFEKSKTSIIPDALLASYSLV